jgi:diguanylate cyclase (GGDEF)-like protein/PAS domain S-box-containing protein
MNRRQYNRTREALKVRLKRYEQSTKALFEHNPELIWWMDIEGSILSVNSRVEEILGFNKNHFLNQSFDRFFADKHLDAVMNSFILARKGNPQNFEAAFIHKDGYHIELNVIFVPIVVNYKIVGIYGIAKDITEQKKSELALKESNDFINNILESITDGFIAIDYDWHITYWNKEAERITGKKQDDILGAILWDVFPQAIGSLIFTNLHKALYEQITTQYEFYAQSTDQWYWFHVYPSKNGLSVYLHDITERKKAEHQIAHMTYYDTLTGLPNQRLFKERLNDSLTRAKSNKENVSVLVLDLDRFKMVNDSLGCDQGDHLMVEISRRLTSCVREDDMVCRYEGDNFAILLRKVNHIKVKLIVERILAEFQKPFVIENLEIVITPSIGISFYPIDGNEGEHLLANADTAMRSVKSKGKNTYQFYAETMNTRSFLTMERELRKALNQNDLMVFYQPQMDLRTGKVIGNEALLRWNHPEWGMVSPDEFIHLAEETGLIVPIGEWVLKTACAQNKAWQDMGYAPMVVSVNLSPRQFTQSNIVDVVKKALKQSDLDSCYLNLEITESMTMDVENAITTLQELQALGVHISVDDFGKGYSSLSYLKRLPLDTLKIDQSFVRDCTVDANAATIVKTIISMSHNLNLNVIAEGIETKEHLVFLRQHLCNEAQGYLFSRPLPAEKVREKFVKLPKMWKQFGMDNAFTHQM